MLYNATINACTCSHCILHDVYSVVDLTKYSSRIFSAPCIALRTEVMCWYISNILVCSLPVLCCSLTFSLYLANYICKIKTLSKNMCKNTIPTVYVQLKFWKVSKINLFACT